MNPDFFHICNVVKASEEFWSSAYPKCEQILGEGIKIGGVAAIGVSLTFAVVPRLNPYDIAKPDFQKATQTDDLENANTSWMFTGTGDLPMILERNLSTVEKSIHGINGTTKPIPAFEGELRPGSPLEIRLL